MTPFALHIPVLGLPGVPADDVQRVMRELEARGYIRAATAQ